MSPNRFIKGFLRSLSLPRPRRWTQLGGALGATRNLDASYRRLVNLYRTPTKYERRIRLEYRAVAAAVFWPGRAAFLQTFLSRKRIFATDFFFQKYEAQARRNLSQSIARIGRRKDLQSSDRP